MYSNFCLPDVVACILVARGQGYCAFPCAHPLSFTSAAAAAAAAVRLSVPFAAPAR